MAHAASLGFWYACRRCEHLSSTDCSTCHTCAMSYVHSIPDDACPVCAQSTNGTGVCTNQPCRQKAVEFGKVHAIGYRAGTLDEAIRALKDEKQTHLAKPLGRLLAGHMLASLAEFSSYDLVLPMPKHPGKVRSKGLDQVKLVYMEAYPFLVLHLALDDLAIAPYLIQVKNVESIRTMSLGKRFAATRGSFALSFQTDIIEDASVIVVDDVLTTGATMSAAAQCLRDAGARRVDGIVLARSPWRY